MVMDPEMEETNPRLKAMFLELVENQLRDNNPPEVRQTLTRLVGTGLSREDAMIYIAQAACVEVFTILKQKKPFNLNRYLKNLAALPQEPKEKRRQSGKGRHLTVPPHNTPHAGPHGAFRGNYRAVAGY
jgi:hypothetical protein